MELIGSQEISQNASLTLGVPEQWHYQVQVQLLSGIPGQLPQTSQHPPVPTINEMSCFTNKKTKDILLKSTISASILNCTVV